MTNEHSQGARADDRQLDEPVIITPSAPMQPSSNSAARDAIFWKLLGLLEREYPMAKEVHLHNETSTRRRDVVGLSNLRDTLDHASRVLQSLYRTGDLESANEDLAQLKEHIFRAMNEGAGSAAEFHISKAVEKRSTQFVYKITLSSAPSDRDIDEALATAWTHIHNGRKAKSGGHPDWLHAVKEFKAAEEIAKSLQNELPPPEEVKNRLVAVWVLGVMGLLLSAAGLVWSFLH